MQLKLTAEDTSLLLEHLRAAHRKQMDNATSWSDLQDEDSFNRYIKFRNEELRLAHLINRIQRQRTRGNSDPNTAETPLADWEKELLSGNQDS